jgi:uncharacterized protein with HEPN domain
MIEAAEAVATFVSGRSRADVDTDNMLLFAVVRAVEIMGEAASKVSSETRAAVPAVPWAQIAAMRNRLIHAYFDIDHDILWRTAIEEVPLLLTMLRTMATAV